MSFLYQTRYAKKSHVIIITLAPFWVFQISDELSVSAVYPDILSNMKDYVYTIAILPSFPFVWKIGENYLGVDIDIIKYLSHKYHFRQVAMK